MVSERGKATVDQGEDLFATPGRVQADCGEWEGDAQDR
jgi:hypothetical protein